MTCRNGTPCTHNKHPTPFSSATTTGGGGGGQFQPVDAAKFQELQQQFDQKWLHSGKPKPTIRAIYNVTQSALMRVHEAYCSTSIGQVPVYNHGKSPGNQQRRFHGTGQMCQFRGAPCSDPKCKACSIIKDGFKTRLAGSTTGTKFGNGVYSSATSSKSWDYPQTLARGEQRVMFVVGVAAGKVHRAAAGGFSGGPPPGYHSLVADASTGLVNFDELVVYHDAAIVPKYLIVFS